MGKQRIVYTAIAVVMVLSWVCQAAIQGIGSVDAGVNGSPPYLIHSITVGDYTVTADLLAPGTSVGGAGRGTYIESADDLDLDTIIIRTPRTDPIWTVSAFGGRSVWYDTNGANPDFFVFEVGMNDAFTMQAMLPGGVLGQAVSVEASHYVGTGLVPAIPAAGGQEIGGLCFDIADLLDDQGAALTAISGLEGIRIDGPSMDPASFVAVVPEPATMTLMALGAAGVGVRRRRVA